MPECTLKDCLFGNVKITKNANPDKSSYKIWNWIWLWIWFSFFPISNLVWGKNVIIFGVDVSSSVHIDNKNKETLILGKGPTQGLCDTTLTAGADYPLNSSRSQIKFCS